MKKLSILLLTVVFSLIAMNANSQFKKIKKDPPKTKETAAPPSKDTSVKGGTNPGGNPTPTTIIKPTKRFDTAKTEGSTKEYGAVVPQGKKPGYIYTREGINERKPLPYDHIREDDATYSQFVWREIDAREKMNAPFTYSAKDETGDQRFFSIILNAIKNSDSAIAFSAEGGDDRFTTPLSYSEVMSLSTNKSTQLDTTFAENPNNPDIQDTVIIWKANLKAPKPDSIYKFRVKEQWFFDKESSRMFVRIIGIAPMAPNPLPPGQKKQVGPPSYYPLFWVYYPDLRATLSKSFAYNPKNAGGRMTWEEIFEGRFFSSYIIKSTLDNPYDKTLAQLIKDPLFRLLEGENIKEKIFNYEQDLWSY